MVMFKTSLEFSPLYIFNIAIRSHLLRIFRAECGGCKYSGKITDRISIFIEVSPYGRVTFVFVSLKYAIYFYQRDCMFFLWKSGRQFPVSLRKCRKDNCHRHLCTEQFWTVCKKTGGSSSCLTPKLPSEYCKLSSSFLRWYLGPVGVQIAGDILQHYIEIGLSAAGFLKSKATKKLII